MIISLFGGNLKVACSSKKLERNAIKAILLPKDCKNVL
jgi:hypothetical protein